MKSGSYFLLLPAIPILGVVVAYWLLNDVPESSAYPVPAVKPAKPTIPDKPEPAIVYPATLGPDPDAETIAKAADPRNTFLRQDFAGHLEHGNETFPFTLRFRDGTVSYRFQNPDRKFTAGKLDTNFAPTAPTSHPPTASSPRQNPSSWPATDLRPDEMFFSYFDWPRKVKLPSAETIKTRKCWVVDLYAPDRTHNYSAIRIFADQQSGWLMKMQAYDWSGKLIKQMNVTKAMKVNGAVFMGSMDVIRFVPGTKKVAGETTFELQKPK